MQEIKKTANGISIASATTNIEKIHILVKGLAEEKINLSLDYKIENDVLTCYAEITTPNNATAFTKSLPIPVFKTSGKVWIKCLTCLAIRTLQLGYGIKTNDAEWIAAELNEIEAMPTPATTAIATHIPVAKANSVPAEDSLGQVGNNTNWSLLETAIEDMPVQTDHENSTKYGRKAIAEIRYSKDKKGAEERMKFWIDKMAGEGQKYAKKNKVNLDIVRAYYDAKVALIASNEKEVEMYSKGEIEYLKNPEGKITHPPQKQSYQKEYNPF